MCCNTAHIIYPKIIQPAKFLFPSLINLVNQEIEKSYCQNIGILATLNTLKYRLYQNNFKKIFIPDLELQNILEKSIRLAIKSESIKIDYKLLSFIINKFIIENNLDGIILGCTEIPIFFQKIKLKKNIIIFDSSEILANYLINYLQC
jgi:aspartate racemase